MRIATFGILLSVLLLFPFAGEAAVDDFTLKHTFGPKRTEFAVTFEFAPIDQAESDEVWLDRIVVRMPAKQQVLRIDFTAGEFAPKQLQEARFTDLHDDGFEDLLVPTYSSPMGNNGFFVWVYLPKTAEFIHCPELSGQSNLEAIGKGMVAKYSRDGGPNRTSSTFRWAGKRFELISVYRHEERNGRVFETQRTKKNGKWIEDFSRPLEGH